MFLPVLKMPAAKHKRFRGFHIEPELDQQMRYACAALDIPATVFIREAIADKLKRQPISA